MGFDPAQGGASGGGGTGADPTFTENALPSGGTISASGYYNNTGAAGTVTMTLAATAGLSVYIKRTASFEVRIAPSAGKQINWSGGVMAADEYLRLLADGDVAHLIVDDNLDIQITSEFGAFAEQTP